MNILQKIFKEHYEEIEYILHPRSIVMENIKKMINCDDSSYGSAMYSCPHCGELNFVPFRCHSRFCPTCGNKYCIDCSTKMSFKLIDCTHRHLIFTIDEDLLPFFLNHRSLLDCLFQAVRSVILRLFQEMNKSRNFVPGFICVLHTFGRSLEWNPHIHCLLTEGGFSDDGFWKVVKHFNYTYLRKSFQTALLNELEERIGSSFKKTKAAIYKKDKNGFYVYAKPNLCDTDSVVKYISRYLGHPVIATSCIDSYDGENMTFHYNKHEDNSYVEKTVPVDFISLLIQHIPEKYFKMTRYYGLYARHRKSDEKLQQFLNPSTESCWTFIHSGSSFFYLLVTILFNVQNVITKWSFWNSTINISPFLCKNSMKGQWQNIIAAPVANVLDFIFCLLHTENINRQESYTIDSKFIEELRQKYIKNPPET